MTVTRPGYGRGDARQHTARAIGEACVAGTFGRALAPPVCGRDRTEPAAPGTDPAHAGPAPRRGARGVPVPGRPGWAGRDRAARLGRAFRTPTGLARWYPLQMIQNPMREDEAALGDRLGPDLPAEGGTRR